MYVVKINNLRLCKMSRAGFDQFDFLNRPDGLFLDLKELRKVLKYFVQMLKVLFC
jgi:hypothetical protein